MTGTDETELLTALLRAEHEAVYAYGVLGARLAGEEQLAARAAFDAHRGWRDRAAAALRDRGAPRPGVAGGYDAAAADRPAALGLAVRVEEGVAQRCRDLVAGGGPAVRSLGVDGLREAAVRAAGWRLRAGVHPATVALPGG